MPSLMYNRRAPTRFCGPGEGGRAFGEGQRLEHQRDATRLLTKSIYHSREILSTSTKGLGV